MIQSITTKFIILILSVLLIACGGGSGNKDTTAIDTTAPVITLNGDAIIEHNYGDGYNDLGASATDNVDSSVTVITAGAVIVNMLNSYVITYTATDVAGNTSSIERTVNVVDLVGPVISLNGDAIIDHNYGDIYTDLGAQATDNVDSSVIVNTTGEVIIDMFSSYVITYTATDAAGNISTVERVVNVVDMIGPVITLNGESSVTLGKGRVYKELSATAIDNIDGEITVDSPSGIVDYDNLGHYELTYSATDSAGNITTLIRTVDIVTPKPFITTWKTDNFGSSADNEILITTNSDIGGYNYNVDWGDGTTDEGLTGDYTHSYDSPGIYTVTINGIYPQLYMGNDDMQSNLRTDSEKLLSIEQWGDGILLSLNNSFYQCSNLISNAKDTPNLRSVTDMSGMFSGATSYNQDLSSWDVSSVTNMSQMFFYALAFNQDISAWDVSSVTNISHMFYYALAFNQDISGWDVSSVTDMLSMFSHAETFNQDISGWDVSSVNNMAGMFSNANAFNHDISGWDVSSVNNMSSMYSANDTFNQDISAWDVSSVTKMTGMFSGADTFNQDISAWDVSSVKSMRFMFSGADAFNQDISAWDVSSVDDMAGMFSQTFAFDQDISTWDVSSVTSMKKMFSHAVAFDQDISSWDVSSVEHMSYMFEGAVAFNQDISAWDVSSVIGISSIFEGTVEFNQDISAWDVSSVLWMSNVFKDAVVFNQDISAWDVSSVLTMMSMFKGAVVFNQDISSWDVSSVDEMAGMFEGAVVFNQDISGWDVSSVDSMGGMFEGAVEFNQDISGWDVSALRNMPGMFSGATSFNQDLSSWDVRLVYTMTFLFHDSGLSTENYDALLKGWSKQQLRNNVQFDASYIQYSPSAQAARDILTNTYGWSITDGGVTP